MATASCSSFVGTAATITNYARLGHVTQNKLPNMLRELLFTREPPSLLENHINKNLYLQRNLRAYEWNIIRTAGTNQYNEFDVPLMYKIIRNLNLVPNPTQGWDSLTPPSSTETTVGDDIERIRRIRNAIVHRGNTNVQDSELDNYFSIFKDIARRLEIALMLSNRQFVSEMENVETCCMDEDTEQHYIKQLTELDKYETELAKKFAGVRKDLARLRSQMTVVTDQVSKLQIVVQNVAMEQQEVIPKHIRDQIKKEINKWKKDDKKYVPTKASKYAICRLKERNCVIVVGSPGVGKTAVTRHVALKMEGMGYTVIPITFQTDIRNFYQPGRQTVFVIDDMCGKFTANKQENDKWKKLLGVVDNMLSDKCKIIVSCRSQVYKDENFCVLAQFKSCECNLISNDLLLSKIERIQIAIAHLGKYGNNISKAMLMKYNFFPLLCFLYSRQNKKNMDINEFFDKPFVVFEKELNSLWNEGEVGQCKICALALCVIYNNKLDEKYLIMEPSIRVIIDDVCDSCGINRGTSVIKIKEELETLIGTYLKKENNVYITIHDNLFDFLVYFCGTKMLECLIKHAMVGIINERFHCRQLRDKRNKDTNEFIIELPDDKLNLYLDRLILDWSNGKFVDLFCNNHNMTNINFRRSLLKRLSRRDSVEPSQLCRITEKKEFTVGGSLEACCLKGYADFLQWFLEQGVDINRCITGTTPLVYACFGNHENIVRTLLDSGAKINEPDWFGVTPLFLSWSSKKIKNGQAVLNLLLKRNACVNYRAIDGSTPLLNALCEKNKIVVNTLLSHSADCNIGFYKSKAIKAEILKLEKPIYYTVNYTQDKWVKWFRENCISSVVDYINQEPNTVLNIIGGATPLHLMCFTNDIDMIRLLLKGDPEIDIRKEDGETPLFVACLFGFIDIATILLEHRANMNIRRNDRTSPLKMAKQKNHTDIISLLENFKLKKKRKCTDMSHENVQVKKPLRE